MDKRAKVYLIGLGDSSVEEGGKEGKAFLTIRKTLGFKPKTLS
jgi:hypothetical protein